MKRKEINSSRTPVYRDSGFELYDAGLTADTFKKETEHDHEPENYIYSRYRNPTVVAAEEEIMKLVKEKPGLSQNAYMGLVMQKLKGVSGKEVMEILKKLVK